MSVRNDASSESPGSEVAIDAGRARHPVIGIGASAGGLEALRAVLAGLPSAGECSYVVAQHMAPHYRSMLADLLARDAAVRVQEVTDGAVPQHGTVYVTPANYDIVLNKGRFRLLRPQERIGPKPSVDKLFIALAEELGEDCGGVILSGTGSDGSRGARAIKAAGGFVIAQDPESAKYDGMPRAAMDSGAVDLVLAPQDIAARLPELIRSGPVDLAGGDDGGGGEPFRGLLDLLRRRTGVDFTRYKPNTIHRRVQRRMAANRIETIAEYRDRVRDDGTELQRLFQELLISATAFFRDPEHYRALKDMLRQRLKDRRRDAPIRVWSAGCATGEEPYSLAILLSELVAELELELDCGIQVFATDLDERAMNVARRGNYPRESLEEVSEDIVSTYFEPRESGYQILKAVREKVVFSRHDLTRDPPFLRLDLIACRNVFIYLEPELQERLIKAFHYALVPSGLLFLGKAESLGATKSFFRSLNTPGKLFERTGRAADPGVTFTASRRSHSARSEQRLVDRRRGENAAAADLFSLIRSFAPDSVVVDEDFRVREVYGEARRYLAIPEGALSSAVDRLLRPDLQSKTMTLLHRVRRSGENAQGMHFEDTRRDVRVIVQPRVYSVALAGERHLVLSFESTEAPRRDGPQQDDGPVQREVQELERELAATREHLQSVIEEQETANEELQALNEELNSANEELQSTNEEFETSNEELQSTNEELTTLNEELNIKSNELLEANAYLAAVQNAIRDPLLIVDGDLDVAGFNDAAQKTLKIEQDHLRRNVRLIPANNPVNIAFDLIERCLREGRKQVLQTQTADQDFQIRCDPILNHRQQVDGVVASFIDNTPISSGLRRAEASEARLAALFENVPGMVTVKDVAGHYTYVNRRFCALVGMERGQILGKRDEDLFGTDIAERIRVKDQDVIRSRSSRAEEEHLSDERGARVFLTTRFPLAAAGGQPESVCSVSTDVTESVESRRRLELVTEVISASAEAILIFDGLDVHGERNYRASFVSRSVRPILGLVADGLVGRSLDDIWNQCFARARGGAAAQLSQLLTGRARVVEVGVPGFGEARWYEIRASFYAPGDADPHNHLCLMIVDITERKISENILREKQEEVLKAAKLAALGEMAAGIAHELNTPLNTVQSYIDLVRRSRHGSSYDGVTVVKALDAVEDTVRNMAEIVTGLRSIARLDLGNTRRNCEIIGMLNEIIRVCDLQLRNKGIPIELRAEVDELHLWCLPTQVTQVFVNLLNNAIDAVRSLEEKWIRIEVHDDDPDEVRIRVVDSGKGIPEKIAAMVMTPFFTTKDEGTGLGLSVSRSLLRAQGGELRIDFSCANTCMEVVLPRRDDG